MERKIILFDLDNTLIKIQSSHTYFDQIIIDVFHEVNTIPPEKSERDKLWRNSDYIKLLKQWNFPNGDHILFWNLFDKIDFKKRIELHKESKLIMYDDVVKVLNRLKESHYIALITNTTEEITRFELESFDISELFDYICTLGDKENICKPSPIGIEIILKNVPNGSKIDFNDVYIIGDSAVDIEAGKNAGIKTIWINRMKKNIDYMKLKPDYIIESLSQLFDIIK